jgi:hypothetical protein
VPAIKQNCFAEDNVEAVINGLTEGFVLTKQVRDERLICPI